MRVNEVLTSTASEPVTNQVFFHVTPARNLKRLMTQGLIPKIGPRSRRIREAVPGIYLFYSVDDAEEAVMNWLGDQFGEDTILALLRVEVPPDHARTVGAGYEVILTAPVPPQNLQIVSREM